MEKQPTSIFIVHRATNDLRRAPMLSALLCSFAKSSPAFLFRCRPIDDESSQLLLSSLSSLEIIAANKDDLASFLRFEFDTPKLNIRSFNDKKNVARYEAFCEIARRLRRNYCRAMYFSPTLTNDDIDRCRVHHLAAELDLLSSA